MSKFNQNIDYTDRLRENMQQIPFSIYQHLVEEDIVLRGRQKVAVKDMAESMFAGNRAVLMWMPTGGGKTVMNARMLEGLHRDAETQRPKRTIFVSDSKEGVKNTVAEIKEFSGLDATPYFSKKKDLSGEVIVTTYASWQRADFPVDPLDIDLVVLDEGHKSLSDNRQETLSRYKNAIWMPLTATPTYDEERSLLEYYALGHRTTIPEAVEHGLISSFRNIVLNTGVEVNLDGVPLSANGEFNEKALEKEINKKGRNQAVGEFLLFGTHPDTGEPLRKLRGIVGCCNVVHTKSKADELNEMHQRFFPEEAKNFTFAANIYGAMSDDEIDQIYANHRAGKIGYLTYADLLIHNYNDKGIQVTLNSRLTQSHVVIQQSHGRGLRIDENNPNKIALCVDIIDNYVGDDKKKAPLVYGASIGTTLQITDEVEQAAKRKRAQSIAIVGSLSTTGANSNNADIQAMLANTKLTVTVEQEEIFALIKDMAGPEIPKKTENDLTYPDLLNTGLSINYVVKGFAAVKENWEKYQANKAAGVPDEQNPKPAIPYNQVADKGRPSQSVPLDKLEMFKQIAQGERFGMRKKTVKDLIYSDLLAAGISEAEIAKGFKVVKANSDKYQANKAAGVPDEQNPEPSIPYNQVAYKGRPSQFIPLDKLELFKQIGKGERFGMREKTENDLTQKDLLGAGLSSAYIAKGFRELKKIWKKYEANKAAGVPDDQNPEPTIPYEQVDYDGILSQYVPLDKLDLFKNIYRPERFGLRKKTANDITYSDMPDAGLSIAYIPKGFRAIKAGWGKYNANKAAGVPDDQNPEPSIPYGQVLAVNGNPCQAVPLDKFEMFKQLAKNQIDIFGNPVVKGKKPKPA